MIGDLNVDIDDIDKDIAKGRNVPTVLKGYEDPASRPPRDENYMLIMNALGRLTQASPNRFIQIQDMSAYHQAFDLTCRLGWFVDAIQLVERIRAEMLTGKQTDG